MRHELLKVLSKKRRRARARGMTLVEIIVVITILALIMGAVAVAVIPQLEQARIDRAKLDIANIQAALKIYYAKKGGYPDTGAGLKALVEIQALEKVPKDPWDTDYQYLLEGNKPVIYSYGADKQSGGDGPAKDISSRDEGGEKK
jgi:general secretion pathway protein G